MVGSWLPHGDNAFCSQLGHCPGHTCPGVEIASLGFCLVGGGMTPKGCGAPEEGTGK